MLIAGNAIQKEKKSEQAELTQKLAEVSPTIDTAPAVIKGIPLNYTVLKRDEEVRASIKRNRLRLTIIPTQDQSAASQADLAATVVSVAIQEQKKSGIPVVIVNMLCQQAANSYGELQLAHAVYIPDGKGFDGKTAKPTWETLSAAPRGFTAQELEYLRLWAEMRGSFQKNGMTDEQALNAAISQRMGMTVESLNPHFNVLEPLEKKLEIAEPAQEKTLVNQNAEIKNDKEFSYSKDTIINAYDDVMQQVVDMRPLGAAKEERGNAKYSDVYSYMLTPNVGVIMQMNLGGTKATQVKAIGVEDGTDQTRAFIVLNCMVLMATVTPEWSGDERGALAKKLRITTAFPAQGDSTSLSHKGRDFQFANNGQYGLTLTIKPSALKQKATPSAPKQPQKQKQQSPPSSSRYSPEVDSLLGERINP